MEGLRQEQYSPAWFERRAFDGLTQTGKNEWDYSDSLLMYMPGSDDTYEAVQETDTPYNRLVTVPERAYLESIAGSVVDALPNGFEYIDLGPGTEHKEQFVFDAAKRQGKQCTYRPIDISERYLALSSGYAKEQGIPVAPLRSSFEELPKRLGTPQAPRFVSIGLTYGNYEPARILPLLKDIAGEKGTAFINAHIRERTDMKALRDIYADVALAMVAPKLRLLGIDPESDISHIGTTEEIKMWYTLRHTNAKLEAKGVAAGDRLMAFESLRPGREALERDVSRAFPEYRLLDDSSSPFVGALLSNP